ncbi:MAG: hypothetical protein J7M40_17410 [Planctomycetes bacterium]|nr:hypothetical protein [Planctomycetota bacterium]
MNTIRYKTLGILALIFVSCFINVLSADTVAQHPILYQGLVSYYEFEDNFADQLGRNDGKLNKNNTSSFVDGLIGKAFYTKDQGTHISLGPDIILARKSFSIQVWVKLDYPRFKHNVHFFQFEQRSVKDENLVVASIENHVKLAYHWNDINGPEVADFSKWTHIVITADFNEYNDIGRSRKIYVNGELRAEDRMQGGIFIGTIGQARIASSCEDTRFDNLGIWYRSLDATEVSALYNDGKGLAFGQLKGSQPSMQFTNPSAGQLLRSDSIVDLKWNAEGRPLSLVNLEYKADNNQWQLIEKNIPSTGSFLWKVPYHQSDNVRLRLTDVSNGKQYTQQNSFSIKPTVVSISDVKWITSKSTPGHRAQIRWNNTGRIERVKIMYSVDGKKWELIDASTENDNIYVWRIPWDLKAESFKVRISDITSNTDADSGIIKVDRK